MTTETNPEEPPVVPEEKVPSIPRAVVSLLLNVIVFPGIGTLASGENKRKRVGFVQLALGLTLLPFAVITGMGGAIIAGVDPETARAWVVNFMLILVAWNMVTSVGIVRDAWRKRKNGRA